MKEAAEDVLPLPSWAKRAWMEVRRAVLYAVIIGGSVISVLKWWKETYPPTEPVTEVQMTERFDALERKIEAVDTRLTMYQDSLGKLYTHIDTSLITPGLNAMVDLQKRTGRMERGQVETRLSVEQHARQGQQSTADLIAQMNLMSSAEQREKSRKEKEENSRLDRLEMMIEEIYIARKKGAKPNKF